VNVLDFLLREQCTANDCKTLAVLVCKFYTSTGPVYMNLCKTHIQKIGLFVDKLVQDAVFSGDDDA
jgi:hypothetical protein